MPAPNIVVALGGSRACTYNNTSRCGLAGSATGGRPSPASAAAATAARHRLLLWGNRGLLRLLSGAGASAATPAAASCSTAVASFAAGAGDSVPLPAPPLARPALHRGLRHVALLVLLLCAPPRAPSPEPLSRRLICHSLYRALNEGCRLIQLCLRRSRRGPTFIRQSGHRALDECRSSVQVCLRRGPLFRLLLPSSSSWCCCGSWLSRCRCSLGRPCRCCLCLCRCCLCPWLGQIRCWLGRLFKTFDGHGCRRAASH